MKRSENRRQESINARNERQARDGGQVSAGSSQIAERDHEGSEGNHTLPADALGGFCDGLHQAL